MKAIDKLIADVKAQKTWHSEKLIEIIKLAEGSLSKELESHENVTVVSGQAKGKTCQVEVIKKYDVVYLPFAGSIPHYILIYKVIDDKAYGAIITSEEKEFTTHEIVKDRRFIGSHVSNTFNCFQLEDAKKKFYGVFESKSEANVIFGKVKDNMLKILM